MSNPQANTFTSYAHITDSSFPAPTNINSDGTPLLPAQSLYREPAATQELQEGVQPNSPVSTHSPYFIHHLDRAISLATAEELRSSGNRAYNELLRDHRELMRVCTQLQAVYMVLSETVHNGFLLATSAATGHSPFAGPAWEGHPYNMQPLLNSESHLVDQPEESHQQSYPQWQLEVPQVTTQLAAAASYSSIPGNVTVTEWEEQWGEI